MVGERSAGLDESQKAFYALFVLSGYGIIAPVRLMTRLHAAADRGSGRPAPSGKSISMGSQPRADEPKNRANTLRRAVLATEVIQ